MLCSSYFWAMFKILCRYMTSALAKLRNLWGGKVGRLVSRYCDTFQCELRIIVDLRLEFCGSINGQVEIEDECSCVSIYVTHVST